MFISILGYIAAILVLSLMMIVHELGHFLAGKALGFNIISYNIFMGPILWKKTGKDGILYTIRLFPIGASVEFDGELPDEDQDEDSIKMREMAEEGKDKKLRAELQAEVKEGKVKEEELETLFQQRKAKALQDEEGGRFFNRPRWARAIVVFMGPFVNFFTAFLAFVILFMASGAIVPEIAELENTGLASKMDLHEGDKIISVNGERIRTALDYSIVRSFGDNEKLDFVIADRGGAERIVTVEPEFSDRYMLGITYNPQTGEVDSVGKDQAAYGILEKGDKIKEVNGVAFNEIKNMNDLIQKNEGRPVEMKVITNDGEKAVEIEPKITTLIEEDGFYFKEKRDFGTALYQGFFYPVSVVDSTIKGLSMLFSGKLQPQEALSGPVGIVVMMGGMVEKNVAIGVILERLLMMFGLISVAVGFTNLLPIPPLDGHHLLILAIEGIRRKDLSLKVKNALAYVGFGLLIILAIYALYIDITRILI